MSKYQFPDYWKREMEQSNDWFSEKNQIYKQNNLIFLGQILNSYSGQHESFRLLLPNIKAVTGFVQYIFLPTAFIGYFTISDMDSKTIMIGDEAFSTVLDQLPLRDQVDEEVLVIMKELFEMLKSSWKQSDIEMFHTLEQVLRKLETIEINHIITSFNVLRSPRVLADWLINEYENEPVLGITTLEEEVNMNVHEFLELSIQAESKPFHSKKFFHSLDRVMIL
ncbi:hypothetical protein [Halalkalibacter akibai]|uniref:Uncharacterized protein n=1 Tax=Halalkalibacter akibai (strain ATCC 43226 / DSM 21942 / CIP 109018 / JCM 9157 / 1139) TaxID=1236973 RepID=W4QRS2_HALA3|nr:hypothetical protein [Halalkalibacter akibai]GAE34805.1 hypothetical protein JCM9157_1885 [Halalkalibacter akibai JCM 9157]